VQVQNNPLPDVIVWQPASAVIDGQTKTLDGNNLRPNTFVSSQGVVNQPILNFEFTEDGADIAEQVTERLVRRNYPLALFLDGEPLLDGSGNRIAPQVQGVITDRAVITGIEEDRIRWLSRLLNSGAYPFAVRAGPGFPLQ
jgi:preprotein translocase subunit SecD